MAKSNQQSRPLFPVPKRFQLFGETVSVVFDEHLVRSDDAVGQARYRINQIALMPRIDAMPRNQDQIEKTFIHEVLHFAFNALGRDNLRDNERMIDQLAGALHQVMKTAEYD